MGDKVTHRGRSKPLRLLLSMVRSVYLDIDDQGDLGRATSNSADNYI